MKIESGLKIALAFVAQSYSVQATFSTTDFESDVLPIIQEKCFRCHSERVAEPAGGLLLDNAQAIMDGSEYGPVIVKMLPEESALYQRVTMPENKRGIMPPAGKGDPLTPHQKEIIANWIKQGAKFGDWTGIAYPTAAKPPKPKTDSRLSIEKYGEADGIRLELVPEREYATRLSPSLVKAKAAEIDALVEAHRKANGIASPPVANDRIFLRRAYLGIVGRTPTHDEAVGFLAANDPNKRSKLIDYLINTEGYVNHWFNFWADLLKASNTRYDSSYFYIEWIKDALRSNMPYDKFAYELITATGMPYQNGATGWTASDENMAPDHVANTMQAFLGMQLQCAQCHDHPFDRWNQYEFQSLVSYYGGVRWNGINNKHFLNLADKAGLELTVKQQQYFGNRMSYNYRGAIWEPSFNRWNRLPSDYQYTDAKPKQAIPPQVIFGHPPAIEDSPREAFGKWITAENNQWFTKAVANRLWKQVMGVGLIDPVDQIKYDTEASIPAALALMETTMKELDYNLKDFLRILFNTQTWQMETMAGDLPEDLAQYHYEGRPLMRMTGEQMWDSLVSLVIVDPDERKGNGSRYLTDEYRRHLDELYFMPIEQLVAYYTDERIEEERKEYQKAQKEAVKVFMSRSKKNQKAAGYGANFNSWSFEHMTDPRWIGIDRGLVRAAELASPAPPYHFIRQFGQSDRQIIGTGRTDPNVTQVLNMLNGPVHWLIDSELSELSKKLSAQETDEEKINVVFRSLLTRNPTEEDVEIAKAVIEANGQRQGFRMIMWALLNTREFMYIQ